MKKRDTYLFAFVILLSVIALSIVLPFGSGLLGHKGVQLGLDLKGGSYLVYQADLSKKDPSMTDAQVMATMQNTIERRVNAYGVTEPIIQIQGNDRMIVQLPGVKDVNQAVKLIGQTALLEFREVELNSSGNAVYLSDYLSQSQMAFVDTKESGSRYFVDSNGAIVAILQKDSSDNLSFIDASGKALDIAALKAGDVQELSWIASRGSDGVQLTGSLLTKAAAEVSTQTTGSQADVNITWNSEGTTVFDEIASRLYARPSGSVQRNLGIFLDNSLISAPQIQEQHYGGKAIITGNFTMQSAKDLANLLSSGTLDVPLKIIQQTDVDATLGADSLLLSLRAGLIGIALVMVFMIVFYRWLGVLATAALLVYGAIALAIFKMIPITLTLPGIAGFIISVGMAVDANVLIFERMKEELRLGRTLEAGVAEGFQRAWPSIRDSNASTFITCIILYWFGSTFGTFIVKGFAVTLFLGVAVSMFSAITVTRTFLTAIVSTTTGKSIITRGIK